MDRLRDLFRSYFPATRYDSERLGPTELPSDIFNDLRNTPLHREAQPIGNHEDTELEGLPHHLDQNNRDIFGQSQHPQTFGSIGREFEDHFTKWIVCSRISLELILALIIFKVIHQWGDWTTGKENH